MSSGEEGTIERSLRPPVSSKRNRSSCLHPAHAHTTQTHRNKGRRYTCRSRAHNHDTDHRNEHALPTQDAHLISSSPLTSPWRAPSLSSPRAAWFSARSWPCSLAPSSHSLAHSPWGLASRAPIHRLAQAAAEWSSKRSSSHKVARFATSKLLHLVTAWGLCRRGLALATTRARILPRLPAIRVRASFASLTRRVHARGEGRVARLVPCRQRAQFVVSMHAAIADPQQAYPAAFGCDALLNSWCSACCDSPAPLVARKITKTAIMTKSFGLLYFWRRHEKRTREAAPRP